MSNLITDSSISAQEFLNKISYPITLEQVLTNVLSLYPSKLKAFTLLNQENEMEILNFPFNPSVIPIEFMIQQALSQASNGNNVIGTKINNTFALVLMDNIYKNKEVIEGETGYPIETLLTKECKFIRKKNTGTSLLLADSQGNIDGDIIEIGISI